ncbi:hypothetical protein [Myxosarcina sp. GI1]
MYPWSIGRGEKYIYPNDFKSFEALSPFGKVFFCASKDREYLFN